jgi:phage terminase Nu1 subunit (DNA packaging protein)
MVKPGALAKILQVGPAAITRWVRRGMPLTSIANATAWHAANIRTRRRRKVAAAIVAGSPPPPRNAREQLDAARAGLAELDLAERRGELLWADEVRLCREKQNSAFRQKMLAIPAKVAVQIAPPGKVQQADEILTQAIYEALAELSGVDDDSDAAPGRGKGNGHA